jgi:hypothetical protein
MMGLLLLLMLSEEDEAEAETKAIETMGSSSCCWFVFSSAERACAGGLMVGGGGVWRMPVSKHSSSRSSSDWFFLPNDNVDDEDGEKEKPSNKQESGIEVFIQTRMCVEACVLCGERAMLASSSSGCWLVELVDDTITTR